MKQYGMTILRVAVGGVYVMQAYLALFASSPRGVAAFIAKLGLPAPTLIAGVLTVYVREGVVLKEALVDHVVGRAHGPGYEYIGLLLAATLALASSGGC